MIFVYDASGKKVKELHMMLNMSSFDFFGAGKKVIVNQKKYDIIESIIEIGEDIPEFAAFQKQTKVVGSEPFEIKVKSYTPNLSLHVYVNPSEDKLNYTSSTLKFDFKKEKRAFATKLKKQQIEAARKGLTPKKSKLIVK